MENQLLSGNTIAGIFAIAAVVIFLFIVILDRLGFKFVREKKEEDKTAEKKPCPFHETVTECIRKVKQQQAVNIEILRQHSKSFEEGRSDFKTIYDKLEEMAEDISTLCKDVAVLAAVANERKLIQE